MATLQNLQEGDIEWRAHWMLSDEILYRCGDFDWVPLLGIWGAIGYAPLLVLRQYRSRQFVPTTHGLAQCEFSYKCDGYKKKIREMTNSWRQTRRLKRLAVGPSMTPEYIEWLNRRINDNIPVPGQGDSQFVEKHVHMVPSELEIIKQDFERRNSELEKKIEQMEGEKMNLRLNIDVQKLETEGLRKGKRKVEEDLNSLKTDYKRLRLSVRTAGLGKTSEQWRQEVQEEKAKADRWEKRFQEAQKQNKSFERSLSKSQNERDKLKARVAELEKIIYQYRNQNSVAELQASLSRIEQMKKTIEELEIASQNYEARIEHLEANEDHQSEQLHYLQDEVARRDHIMGEAVVQIQGVAEHLQTLEIQADILSVKYESESDQGQKLASLLREIKVLSIRARPYL
ncbi:centrosomal protein of 135 kDa-like [Gossypium hirsutum]|uniref:Centrosomal protein of 135 kDa-like n=1 Tax=Gossypium hirsutum TaxID=3635 RepID=A0A1U8L0U1_GOSHI|nr:centrosomal protein of 135 kDa-like [Gossypium hirsutum]